ncbi:transcription termination factor NusA [Patescibacteria group bacterium]|nr:transcription termination factor NusA [Patescibacteria group bacterium]MCG2694942.1 transcription termination factor NusA [Candidatus Parcubacteria bacterium]
MFDLKTIHAVLDQLEQEKGIPRAKVIEAIEMALASAYKKEYGKKGQIIKANFDINSGKAEFSQIKIIVDESMIKPEIEEGAEEEVEEEDVLEEGEEKKIRFNTEQHIMLEDAKRIKTNAEINEEIIFPLESKDDFGRIAAQTAKQTIIQRIREAEKSSVFQEFGTKQGEIISGTVQRIEKGNIFIDMGRATGILPYEEQIRSEKYKQGERIRAYLYSVEETPKGVFLKLSRTHPQFLQKLFEIETPEIASNIVEIKGIVREAGSRSKVAVVSHDEHIDPIGSMVGQRGVRVSTIMSELGGEKIDIIEWSEDPQKYIEDALSPAKVLGIEINEDEKTAIVRVSEDQLSLAIGKGGQNVRLAAKITGWKIDIKGIGGEEEEDDNENEEDKTTKENSKEKEGENKDEKNKEE